MTKKLGTQLPKSCYYENYDVMGFISYFYQIDSVIKTKPKTILEVGVGNNVVSNYLDQFGFNIITCDFNENLSPDCLADIRHLPFRNSRFDVVFSCEVLEHIPFKDLPKALSELRRVSKKYVIISIPYSCFFYGL
jgi:SAM-dependent methyltransferase